MQIDVNNDILIWAVERAGFSLEEISKKIPQFLSWIEGKKKPTVRQLESFSQKVHVPFGYLFVSEPPEEKLPIPFFRTIETQDRKVSLNVYETILLLQERQEWLTEYLKDDEYEPLDFVGRCKSVNNISEIVTDIRKTLKLKEDWANELPNWEKAKEHFTQRIEDAGIITVFNSIVGSNTHRAIKVEDCRGFVLVNNYAPFMFINSADSKSAQMFTLAHETAHIWLGKSAGFDLRQLQSANDSTEKLCDRIAAELLVPESSLLTAWSEMREIESLSKQFKVSQIVIARRLLDLGMIKRNEFFDFYDDYMNRDFEKKAGSDGGDFYLSQRKRLGARFISLVNKAVRENKLLIRDAYKLTGMKGNTYRTFMKEYLR